MTKRKIGVKFTIPVEAVKYILALFLVTRVVLCFIGAFSSGFLGPSGNSANFAKVGWLNIWGQWDSSSYLTIARDWYPATLESEDPKSQLGYYFAFFPFYPLLVKIVGWIVNSQFLAGILISNLSLFLSSIILYIVTLKVTGGDEIARGAVKYLYLFPTSFILSGVFTESLSLLLLLLVFYFALEKRWVLAGTVGFLLSLTKLIGVLVFIPLAIEYLRKTRLGAGFFYLLLIPAGTFIFFVYSFTVTGDFLKPVEVIHSLWGQKFVYPWTAVLRSYQTGYSFMLFNVIAVILLFTFLLYSMYKVRIGISLSVLTVLLFVSPLFKYGFGSINSMLRYSLIIFPLYIYLSVLTTKVKGGEIPAYAFAILQGFLMMFWSAGTALVV